MSRRVIAGVATAVVLAGVLTTVILNRDTPKEKPVVETTPLQTLHNRYQLRQETNPSRTLLADSGGQLVAVLTTGARTVLFKGPERTFTESATTTAKIVTKDWVRIAPVAFDGTLTQNTAAWLLKQIGNTSEDLLAVAQQYSPGAPVIKDSDGIAYAGDAGFGLLTGEERDGADFFEYLGIPWRWADGTTSQIGAAWKNERRLDCSGFMRLVYGYRSGIPLLKGNKGTDGLPRSAWAMADHAPRVVIATAASASEVPADLSGLQPGDAVFFALHDDAPDTISHSGIYLGKDTDGRRRFISSRQTADGPTWGDKGGKGVIDSGTFGRTLRKAVRF